MLPDFYTLNIFCTKFLELTNPHLIAQIGNFHDSTTSLVLKIIFITALLYIFLDYTTIYTTVITMSVIINFTYFHNIDDNSMKYMIQAIILKHREMAIVMLCPAGLRLQQSLRNQHSTVMIQR